MDSETHTTKGKKRQFASQSQKSSSKKMKLASLSASSGPADSDSEVKIEVKTKIKMTDEISRLFDFSSAKGDKKLVEDTINKQIAKEITVDIQNYHVLKASKAEKVSWTDKQRLNYSAGIHPSDLHINVKIHAI